MDRVDLHGEVASVGFITTRTGLGLVGGAATLDWARNANTQSTQNTQNAQNAPRATFRASFNIVFLPPNWEGLVARRFNYGTAAAANAMKVKEKNGGRDRDRTGDPLLAKQMWKR
jgi:hypothetical protein